MEQDNRSTTYQEVKTTIKTWQKKKWLRKHQYYNKKDQYYGLYRRTRSSSLD